MSSTIPIADLRFLADASEPTSDTLRRAIEQFEPRCQRTYTPTGAVIARSAGCHHFTPEGRRLVDFTSGVLVANLGHNPTRWWRRVFDYMGLSSQLPDAEFLSAVPLTAYNAITTVEAEAARRLIANMRAQPGGGRMEQVLWAASGSEAVIKALRVALNQRPGANVILATRHGFHGKKGLAEAVTGSESDDERDSRVHFLQFPREECASLERRRQPIDLAPYRAELEEMVDRFGDRLCCLITEPYLGGAGSYHPQVEYMQLIEQFCRDNGILFILDEVQSNFGRTGEMYAFTTYGVEPDLVVLGKGIANGVPVDAVVGPADVLGKLGYGGASDTWSAHPLGCAAVLATLDEFEQSDVLEHAAQLSEVLEAGLVRLTELDAIEAIRGEGTVWGVHCTAIGTVSAAEVANEIVRACYLGDEHGRAIHLMGPLAQCVLRIAPPLVMPLAEAREYLAVMYELIASVGARLSNE
jgi:4-aminobutyrate aminotransferase-like enzyme